VPAPVEFDEIAPFYDETRPAPSSAEIAAISELLEGCRTVVDAGVGTGRFAVPLSGRGFDMVGVDLSMEMMRRARKKGIRSLLRADLRKLPLRDRSVDGAFMAHVLQLLPDPWPALRELGRVARKSVVVAVPEWGDERRTGERFRLRTRYREIAAEMGYPLPPRAPRYSHSLEELSRTSSPREVRAVERPERAKLTPEERLVRWERLAFGRALLPPEAHAEIIRRLKGSFPSNAERTAFVPKVRFAAWDPVALRETAPRTSEEGGGVG
jgi:ubiquinone/menaquinone biosynthesis C-methylase UbiE